MDTPICDFVQRYVQESALRLHMPGHKGNVFLGMEPLDITEIDGADSLYEANGIIANSEEAASALFGCKTLYSAEGASQCVRAMLYLAMLYAKHQGRKPTILAGRNAHKSLLSAVALLGMEVVWLYPKEGEPYLSCGLAEKTLEDMFAASSQLPAAVYLTSPDYLGNMADIRRIAQVCRRFGVLLLVDNAHGAYLKFLPQSQHPIDLGADICCDSAHKTLPVLTGGAYLHISSRVPHEIVCCAKDAMALFGSTSPSYLILQSLDAANRYLQGYPELLRIFLPKVRTLKQRLSGHGYCLYGDEPLKLTILPKSYGYTGKEIADILLRQDIVCEFADQDHLVLMFTPETGEDGLMKLEKGLLAIPPREPVAQQPPRFYKAQKVLSIRDAALSLCEVLPVEQCEGRILAGSCVGCPPAVPILVCGERIDQHAIDCFRYYGINRCSVVKGIGSE